MAKSLDLIKVKLWFAGLQRLMFWFTTIFFVYLMLCYNLTQAQIMNTGGRNTNNSNQKNTTVNNAPKRQPSKKLEKSPK